MTPLETQSLRMLPDPSKSLPLVTIVTPSFNQGPFIRATIESVLSQDYPNIEYVIMDGGSTDETTSVVKEYASRLTFISEKDRGQSHAINKGFRAAKGSIVSWLNSDDVFLPGAVRAAVNGFGCNPAAGAVYGEGYQIDKAGALIARFPYTEPFNLWKLIHLSDYILQQTVFFRKSVLDEVGYLEEELHYTMDWDLLIRIGLQYPLVYLPEYLACLREYPEAKSFSGGAGRLHEIRRMLRKHCGMSVAPAVVVYGLDTYARLWCMRLERLSGRKLAPVFRLLQLLIRRTAGMIAGHILFHAQGLYSDGWVGPVVRYALRRGNGTVLIEGHIPYRIFAPLSQRFRIHVNGRSLGNFPVPAGDFQFKLDLSSVCQGQPVFLRVACSRWRMPLTLRRRVAFRLTSIRWEEGQPSAA